VRHDDRFESRAKVGRGIEAGGGHVVPEGRASEDIAGEASIAYVGTPAKRGREVPQR
jgi:hypothetical protein